MSILKTLFTVVTLLSLTGIVEGAQPTLSPQSNQFTITLVVPSAIDIVQVPGSTNPNSACLSGQTCHYTFFLPFSTTIFMFAKTDPGSPHHSTTIMTCSSINCTKPTLQDFSRGNCIVPSDDSYKNYTVALNC